MNDQATQTAALHRRVDALGAIETSALATLQRSVDRLADKLDEHVDRSHEERKEMDVKIESVKKDISSVNLSIADILGKLKGGWFVVLILGTLVGAAVTWFLSFRSHS